MKGLLLAILTVILILSSIAVATTIPLVNPQSAAAEEPESGVIVLDQNIEAEYTGNSWVDTETGDTVYEYEASVESVPLYMPDLVTRIDPTFYWDAENNEWYSGVNLLDVRINGSMVTAHKDGEEIQWDPVVYIGNTSIPVIGEPELLSTDPINDNYHNNILEWDYGTCVRQIRIIEGLLVEKYIFSEDPGADVRIESNLYKTANFVWIRDPYAYDASFHPLEVIVDDAGKMVEADEFANAAYPVVVDDTLPIYGSSDDGMIFQGNSANYNTVHSMTTGYAMNAWEFLPIGQIWSPSESSYWIYRSFLFFKTSSLPSEATITDAQLKMWGWVSGSGDESDVDFYITVQNGMPTYPHMPLESVDYYKGYYSGNGGQLYTSGFYEDGWNFLDLNSTGISWINRAGWTKFCLRGSSEINGQTPANSERVSIRAYEGGTGSIRLVVRYTIPSPPIVSTHSAINVEETSATLRGQIIDIGSGACDQRGFDWGYSSSMSYEWTTGGNFGTDLFTYDVYSLNKGDRVYYRAKAHNYLGWGYGGTTSFITKPDQPGWFSAYNPTMNSIDLSWGKGDGAYYACVRYKAGSYPTSPTDGYSAYYGTGDSTTVTGLSPNTQYYFCAWSQAYDGGAGPYSDSYISNTCATLSNEAISTPWTPSGPSAGNSGDYLTFSTGGATSSLDHPIQYIFYWGDGSSSGWLPIGTTSAAHAYSNTGTTPKDFYITAYARCATHTNIISGASGSKKVTILNPAPTPTPTPSPTPSPTPTPTPTVTPWSFAIITDLHIGETGSGVTNYGATGWFDGDSGEEYAITKQLRETVNAINANIELYHIKFVVILGDITDSAEASEILKAQSILNNLNLSVPWIPLIGNHDVWPYSKEVPVAPNPIDAYNDAVDFYIYDKLIGPQYDYLTSHYDWNWNLSDPVQETADGPKWYFTNLAFDYGGYHFIGSDFNGRNEAIGGPGVPAEADLHDFVDYSDSSVKATWPWFRSNFNDYISLTNAPGYNDIILLSHHPMYSYYFDGFDDYWGGEIDIMSDYFNRVGYGDRVAYQFYGHLHGWNTQGTDDDGDWVSWVDWDTDTPFGFQAIQTIDTKGGKEPNIRIVNISAPGSIDWQQTISAWDTAYHVACPVDLIVTDPDGLVISKEVNQITDAIYNEQDSDGDGMLDDTVLIKDRKPGNYSIQVVPEANTSLSDTFTLTVSPLEDNWASTPIVLANNVSIEDIPVQPYTYQYTQRITTLLNYSGDTSGYRFGTVDLNAVLTTDGGSPISGKTINFIIGNQSASAVTDSNGLASISLTLDQSPAAVNHINIGFDGDIDYLPYYDSQPFEIINKLPVADVGGPYTSNEGSPITFDGSSSDDPDGTIVSYEWDLNGDSNFSDAQGAVVQHTWPDDYTGNIGLRVTDDCGANSTAATTVTINNVPPTVEAGPDIACVLKGSTVNFSGSFTDPGTLDTHTIIWSFGDGKPTVSGTLTPSHTYTAGGNYTVTLNVTDDDGGVGTDTLTVHVNYPPVANSGGPYTGNEGSSITFNGSGSHDIDGTIAAYSWNFGDGSAPVTGTATPAHAYGDNGVYTVTLTVTDNNGAIVTATTTATIANVAPAVNAGPDMEDVPIGSTINFNGSFTDPGWLDAHTIKWNFGDGTPAVTGTLTPSHAYSVGGDYIVTLNVTDDDGGLGTDTAAINVNVPPVPVPGGPYTGDEGSPIAFNGSGSYDPDGTIVSYEWDLDNDGAYDDATGPTPSFTWNDDYGGTVGLKVTDDTGEAVTAATTVIVNNVAPAVDAGANVDYVLSGSPVNFSGGFTDPGTGDTHTIAWNFGDGTPTVTGTLTPTHTYASGGDYTVTLTVTDDDEGVGSDTLTVHVNDAPIADPAGPYTSDEGSDITFNGSSSYDPDGSIVSYEWDLDCDGDFSDAQGAIVQNTWPDDYACNVSLKVTDNEGATAIVTTTVTVNNVPPTVEAGPNQSAECCVTNVSFNGSFTDPSTLDTHTITWNFGDGGTASGTLSPIHKYCNPGLYNVTLTVTDDDGGVGSDTMTVHVVDTIQPLVNISSPMNGQTYINTQGLIAINYTASDICDQTPNIVITLDGVAINDENVDPSVLALGKHILTVTVTDSSGNVATASVTFTIKPQLSAWGRTWSFLEWYTCGHPTNPADFFGSYSYPLVTANDSIYSWINADDTSYWRHTDYKSLPTPWEQSQLFVYKVTQNRRGVSNLSITWTGHGGNGDLIYHTKLKIWNYRTGSWNTLVDVTSPGSKTFQTYDRGITTNATDFIEAGTGNVSILVSSDDNGRGLTEDTEGIFTDHIALNVNAANTPASPSTTTYNFASGGGTNKWCWEGHVHMIDWNGGHPTTPADFANSYGYVQGGSSAYSTISSSDDSRWKSNISHNLGCCSFDRNCELFKFNVAENLSNISNICLKWEGHGTTGETIYYTTLKIWNHSTGTWQQLHNQQNTTSDVTWIDNITSNCSNYIDGTGNLYVLASAQRSGLSGNCGIWTDYIELTITHQ